MMRWLLTYADLVTLLLVFFIIMFAMSTVKTTRYEALVKALHASFHGKNITMRLVKVPQKAPYPYHQPSVANFPLPPAVNKQALQQEDQLYEELKADVDKNHLQNMIQLSKVKYGVNVFFLNGVLFASASAHVSGPAGTILGDLATVLKSVPNTIVVQGYADNQPIHTAEYHSNWDLSVMRAARVADYWMGKGVNPNRMMLEGYGQWYPLSSNATRAGMAQNRTVRAVVLNINTDIENLTLGTYGNALLGKNN